MTAPSRLITFDYDLTIESFIVCCVVLIAQSQVLPGCLIAILTLKDELARGSTILISDMLLCLRRLPQAFLWRCSGLFTLTGVALHALSTERSASILASKLCFAVIILNAY